MRWSLRSNTYALDSKSPSNYEAPAERKCIIMAVLCGCVTQSSLPDTPAEVAEDHPPPHPPPPRDGVLFILAHFKRPAHPIPIRNIAGPESPAPIVISHSCRLLQLFAAGDTPRTLPPRNKIHTWMWRSPHGWTWKAPDHMIISSCRVHWGAQLEITCGAVVLPPRYHWSEHAGLTTT